MLSKQSCPTSQSRQYHINVEICGCPLSQTSQFHENSLVATICVILFLNFSLLSSSMLKNNGSVSIPISDDEFDELEKMRVRARRKRKKPGNRVNNELARRVFRVMLKYWVVVFLLAAGLLLLEATRIGRKSEAGGTEKPMVGDTEVGSEKNLGLDDKPDGNLNRLDAVTRMVAGVRERCLKLLPPNELEQLDIPVHVDLPVPEIDLIYLLDTRLLTREKKVFSDDGGFRISNEDRTYMQTCSLVVATCAFGGGDDLYQPIGMSKASLRKILGHIWVDSESQFRRDPLGVFEALLWRSNSELAISQHGARSSVYDEAGAVVKKHKATPEEVEVQIRRYRRDRFPDDKRFNGHKALAEASVIVREHSAVVNLFMCLWFNEVVRFTSRDQLSFPYVLWRLKLVKKINMFPVCIREDPVNSMGHIRKAKPRNVSRLVFV